MDKIYPEEHIQAIANAIRRKNGKSVNYLTSEMAGAIDQLVSYPEPTGTQTITENGIVDVKDKAYADVNVQASATLISKTVTANGEYDAEDDEADGYSDVTVNVPNSYAAADEGKVVSNGALVAQTSTTVTQNGTIDTTLNNEVVVNVQGGGGIQTIARADWNALTTAQKQAYGLVGIVDAASGFMRGDLVYGADYIVMNKYIPNSDEYKVLCEAYVDLYETGDTTWGKGDSPVTFTSAPTLNVDHITMLGNTSGIYGYVDLGANDTPFTAYIVAKSTDGSSYRRLISAFSSRGTGRGIMLYGTNINISSWASDTSTGISSTSDYFVGVIQFAKSGSAKGIAGNADSVSSFVSKSPSAAGRYVTIGRTDTNSSTSNAEPADLDIKYIAVVADVESESAISANVQNLISEFL